MVLRKQGGGDECSGTRDKCVFNLNYTSTRPASGRAAEHFMLLLLGWSRSAKALEFGWRGLGSFPSCPQHIIAHRPDIQHCHWCSQAEHEGGLPEKYFSQLPDQSQRRCLQDVFRSWQSIAIPSSVYLGQEGKDNLDAVLRIVPLEINQYGLHYSRVSSVLH